MDNTIQVALFLLAVGATGAPQETVHVRVRQPNRIEQPARVAVSGSVDAQDTIDLGFQVAGRVKRVLVQEGAAVRPGQIVAELDPVDYRIGVDSAQAQAAAARAQFEKAQAGPRRQEVELARIQFERADDEYRRMKFLFDRKSLAPSDFKKVEAAYLAARQQYETAREGTRPEDVKAAEAQLRQAEAGERLAAKRLEDTILRSPIAGTVARRGTDPGEMIAAGMPVFTLMDVHNARIRVGVPESDIGLVRVGQRASVDIPALNRQSFSGRVEIVGSAAEPTSRTFPVKIAVPNPQRILKAGMIAEAAIDTGRRLAAITVPGDAIVRDSQGATLVYIYFPEQKRVYARRVEPGSVAGREIEIRSGLTGDELVVVGGQNRLRDGAAVEAERAAR